MIIFLEPHFEQKPWAGKDLTNIYDCKENTGEAWIISGIAHKSSIIKNGRYKGKTLRYLYTKHPELFDNFPSKEFPILIKLISSKEDLSVQVHPNDNYAIKNFNSLGKFECWYILDENKSKDVVLGIKANNGTDIKKYLENNRICDYLINKEIKPKDLVVVEPGIVHAIKKDSFVLEIQESSDITFRLYDYNRFPQRQLHIEDSLNVINYNINKNYIHDFSKDNTFKNEHFNLYKLLINGIEHYDNKGFELFYCLNGHGKVNNIDINKGDSFILTNDSIEILIEGKLELLACVPKVKKEVSNLKKIALITGITNQTGTYLTELLLENNYEVHGLIQSSKQVDDAFFKNLITKNQNSLFFHIGDLLDSSNISRLIETIKPDEIYHLASQSHVDLSFDLPELTTNINCLGTLRLLEAIKRSESPIKIFNLSTCQLFKGDIYPQTLNTNFEPTSPYAVSKLYSHYMVKNYRENYNIFAVNGICYNQESPRREETFLSKKVCEYLKRVKKGSKEILYLGNLNSLREWGHAKDYAKAMFLALNTDKPRDYIISTGEVLSVRDFVKKAFLMSGYEISFQNKDLEEIGINQYGECMIKISRDLLRPTDANVLVGDSSEFCKATHWKAEYDINKLLQEMLED